MLKENTICGSGHKGEERKKRERKTVGILAMFLRSNVLGQMQEFNLDQFGADIH